MQDENIVFFLFASSVALIFVVTGFFLFISLFFRAKRKSFQEQQEAKLNFQKELNRVSSEIQIETLNNLGRELHDNIGQLLAVTKIHADNVSEDQTSESSVELSNIIDQVIKEVRHLSRSLNTEGFDELGFEKKLKLEADRINKLKGIEFSLTTKNDISFSLNKNRGIMLFRIIQEFISNTLRHSRADKIGFSIEGDSDEIKITGKDNGVGFNLNESGKSLGSGIKNMKNRAKLIGAILQIESVPDKGTKIEITIPKDENYEV